MSQVSAYKSTPRGAFARKRMEGDIYAALTPSKLPKLLILVDDYPAYWLMALLIEERPGREYNPCHKLLSKFPVRLYDRFEVCKVLCGATFPQIFHS